MEVVCFISFPLSVASVFQGREDTLKNDGMATIFLNQTLPPATFYYPD